MVRRPQVNDRGEGSAWWRPRVWARWPPRRGRLQVDSSLTGHEAAAAALLVGIIWSSSSSVTHYPVPSEAAVRTHLYIIIIIIITIRRPRLPSAPLRRVQLPTAGMRFFFFFIRSRPAEYYETARAACVRVRAQTPIRTSEIVFIRKRTFGLVVMVLVVAVASERSLRLRLRLLTKVRYYAMYMYTV